MADCYDTSSRTLSNESVNSDDGVYSDDDLSPAQMNALLHRAADRIRARRSSVSVNKGSTFTLPKIEHSALPVPYVRTTGQVSVADPKALVPDSARALLEKPRKIVDPIAAEAARAKGMYAFFLILLR
jgi:hypothetical protein